ncbi:Qat anti-phage system ATPase QatA [Xanthobacter agilis]
MSSKGILRSLGYIVDHETRIDLLRNEAIAGVVVELITSRGPNSITIGVHGDWGAGKSSVLNMIEASSEKGARAFSEGNVCLRFNGWEFQGFEDAKIALIEGIVTQLAARRTLSAKAKAKLSEVIGRIDFLKLAKRGAGLAFNAFTGMPSPDQLAALLSFVESKLSDPVALVTKDNAEAALNEVKSVLKEKPESRSVPKEIREFHEAFESLLAEAEIESLVVLVDDLDRCLPETAIQTLEAIRLFVSLPRTAFVIGADERMIEYAVRSHFKDLPEDEIRRGYPRAYLEKLIQVPWIPALGEAETRIYVTMILVGALVGETSQPFNKLLERAKALMAKPWERQALEDQDLNAAFSEKVPPEVAKAASTAAQIGAVLAQGTSGNPRMIKRFLNALNLRLAVSEARGFGGDIDQGILAKLMLAEFFFPDQFAHIGASVAASDRGSCPELVILETVIANGGAATGTDGSSVGGANEIVTEWLARPGLARWAAVQPSIGETDLRPYLFVVNDRHSFFDGAKPMSAKLRALLSKLLGGDFAARGAAAVLAQLDGSEAELLFSTMKAKLLTENSLLGPPEVAHGLAALVEAQPGFQLRLVEALEQLAPDALGAWIATKFDAVVTTASAKSRLGKLRDRWASEGSPRLKAALKVTPSVRRGS